MAHAERRTREEVTGITLELDKQEAVALICVLWKVGGSTGGPRGLIKRIAEAMNVNKAEMRKANIRHLFRKPDMGVGIYFRDQAELPDFDDIFTHPELPF